METSFFVALTQYKKCMVLKLRENAKFYHHYYVSYNNWTHIKLYFVRKKRLSCYAWNKVYNSFWFLTSWAVPVFMVDWSESLTSSIVHTVALASHALHWLKGTILSTHNVLRPSGLTSTITGDIFSHWRSCMHKIANNRFKFDTKWYNYEIKKVAKKHKTQNKMLC